VSTAPRQGNDAEARDGAQGSLSGIVARLTFVNAVILGFGLLTGPLMARALGPEGRGAYAAVVGPLSLAPLILTFGLPVFVSREAANGVSPGRILGSIGPFLFGVSVICVCSAPWIADYFGQGRAAVRDPLLVGLLLMPMLLLSTITFAVVSGLQFWNRAIASRLTGALVGVVGTVTLYACGQLTVFSASCVLIGGSLAAAVPTLSVLRGHGRFLYDRHLARRAVRLGPAAWLWQTGALTNSRIDQLLMVTLTSERQLGLYAIAVTIGSLCNVFLGALGPALLPRMVAGGHDVTPRTFRITIVLTLGGIIPIGIAAPYVVPFLFGGEFRDAVPMVWVLLIAAVPSAGRFVLTSALLASASPKWAAIAEGTAVVFTVVGLLLLLPTLGGIGAGLVSIAAYTASLAILLYGVHRRFDLPISAFCVFDMQT
jgi:O-antigen/teichoic acid export membrane protein